VPSKAAARATTSFSSTSIFKSNRATAVMSNS
jgi:hypothetical protein